MLQSGVVVPYNKSSNGRPRLFSPALFPTPFSGTVCMRVIRRFVGDILILDSTVGRDWNEPFSYSFLSCFQVKRATRTYV